MHNSFATRVTVVRIMLDNIYGPTARPTADMIRLAGSLLFTGRYTALES